MTPLGEQLRAERERRGQALAQVSEATRVREVYLEALERHDWEALPADVFTRGYVRAYAQHLGLDPEHLLKAYARERRIAGGDSSPRDDHGDARAFLERLAQTQGVEVRRPGTRLKWIALGGAAVAALAAWTVLGLLGPVWRESPATKTPTREEPPASLTTPATAALEGDDSSPADLPERVLPTAPALPPPSPSLPTGRTDPPQQPEPASPGHLTIGESGVGTAVVSHRLVGRGDRFREGTDVWFWTSVLGGRPGDQIRHVWLHEGRSIAEVELRVNGAYWRTQSRRSLPQGSTGDWTVEARDWEGRVIATARFTCVAAEP